MDAIAIFGPSSWTSLARALGGAIWQLDTQQRRIIGAGEFLRLTRVNLDYADLLDRPAHYIHSHDRLNVLSAFRSAIHHNTDLDIEYRIARFLEPDLWLHTISPALDNYANARVFLTIDITSRKRIETELSARIADARIHINRRNEHLQRIAEAALPSCPTARAPAPVSEVLFSAPAWLRALYGQIWDLADAVISRDAPLLEAIERLVLGQAQAVAADRAKSEFLAMMSHELRTPLNAVIGYGELVEEQLDQRDGVDDVRTDVSRLLSAARSLLAQVNEILDLSKIEAGRMTVELERVHVAEILARVMDVIEPLAAQSSNRVETHFDPDLPLLFTDDAKLVQCLINLAGNACKFTESGLIRILVRHAEERDKVEFVVSDTGRGISAVELANLFQPYADAGASMPRRFGGTGLGVAITRRLAELLGGGLSADSFPGHGSRFSLIIAAQLGDAGGLTRAAAS